MIKIIVSGTYDGFSPRYSSDGNVEDNITRQLLDRRSLFTRDVDRLYKEGYAFQTLCNEGILYHKIILLYDGFGRDGFMMASIFLPVGDGLEGGEIKNALDSVINHYKAYTVNGVASFEIDWTFLNRIADNLNGKVEKMAWRKRPRGGDSSLTALIKGTEGRVGDYFQYPNPLNSGCEPYGFVILTESLLDPKMQTVDGKIGYKALDMSDVDIDNPEYTIEYTNSQQDARLSGERKTITKKELDSATVDIPLGTYSRPGYRSQQVSIKAGTKSRDGFAISVDLPSLMQKKSTVRFEIYDKEDSTKTISPIRCEITLTKASSPFERPRILTSYDGQYNFVGEECESRWDYTVKSETYENYTGEIIPRDGDKQTLKVCLKPKPLWKIYVQIQDNEPRLAKEGVDENDLANVINKFKKDLSGKGLSVGRPQHDNQKHRVTIVGTKKTTAPNETGSGEKTRNSGTDNREDAPQKQLYYIRLDEASRKFPLFRKYEKKKQLLHDIDRLAEEIKGTKSKLGGKSETKNKRCEIIDGIANALKERKGDDADSYLRELERSDPKGGFVNSNEGQIIFQSTRKAMATIKRCKRIPSVVASPKDVKYNYKNHSLEYSTDDESKLPTSIKFNQDNYEYWLSSRPQWEKKTLMPSSSQPREVERRRTPGSKFKIIAMMAFAVVAVAVVTLLVSKGESKDVVALRNSIAEKTVEMQRFPSSYCDSTIFNSAKEFEEQWQVLAKEDESLLKDSTYMVFDSVLKKQDEYRIKDSACYHQLVEMLILDENEFKLDQFDRIMRGDGAVMTEGHKKDLDSKLKERSDRLERKHHEEETREEENLYQKCMSPKATVADCDAYIKKYNDNGLYENNCNDVKRKRKELADKEEQTAYNNCMKETATLETLDKYLKKYEKNTSYKAHVDDVMKEKAEKKKKMAKNGNGDSPSVKPTVEKKEITNVIDLFDALKWDNIADFDKKYSVTSQIKDRKVNMLIMAKKKGQKKYEKAYNEIKNDQKVKPVDKLTKLESVFGMGK